ncbi:MAG: hypothetical protein M1834_000296 [Cirrosporium novae-zelandiae]|nr:MAG: hypothetical protein M1834_000296 [Cirrosporium novae-zelandiae]
MFSPLSSRTGHHDQLSQEIEGLKTVSKLPARQRSAQLPVFINPICSYAYEKGLFPDALNDIVELVTIQTHLDQTSITSLIRNLYPVTKVSSDVIVRVVGALGEGEFKPKPVTQDYLVRWLILIYDELEEPSILGGLYGVLFNLLDMISLRNSLCHLLSLVTRRKHVKPFRIQALLELSRSIDDPALKGLLRVYKNYYPDVIVGDSVSGRVSLFKPMDLEWKQRLHIIREANTRDIEDSYMNGSSFKVVQHGAKRSKISVIPEVYTSYSNQESVTLEEIRTVDDFVENFEKLELPSQAVSAISGPVARKYMLLNPSDISIRRRDQWLSAFLNGSMDDKMEWENEDKKSLLIFLQQVLSFAQRTKELPAPVENFLIALMEKDLNEGLRELALALLSYIPIQPFKSLQKRLLDHLESHFLSSFLDAQEVLLKFYTSLLFNWTAILIAQHPKPTKPSRILSQSLNALIAHATTLSLTLLTNNQSPTNVTHIIRFHTTLAQTVSLAPTNPNIRIFIPPASLVYTLFFASSLSTLSRVCTMLATYKRPLEYAQIHGGTFSYSNDFIKEFNGYVMDICNCIWRNRAFNTTDTNAVGCLLPPAVVSSLTTYASSRDYNISSLFSISFHPALFNISNEAFHDVEDEADRNNELQIFHTGPVTAKSLERLQDHGGLSISWAEYRLEILGWLEKRGVKGVWEFVGTYIKGSR